MCRVGAEGAVLFLAVLVFACVPAFGDSTTIQIQGGPGANGGGVDYALSFASGGNASGSMNGYGSEAGVVAVTFSSGPVTAAICTESFGANCESESYSYGAGGTIDISYDGQTYAGTFTSGSGDSSVSFDPGWFDGTFTLAGYAGAGTIEIALCGNPECDSAQLSFSGTPDDPPGDPTPEPGTLALMGTGLVALGLLGRRVRRRAGAA